MEYISDLLGGTEVVITIMVAIAAFIAVLSFLLPYMQPDNLGDRMKAVASERERIRQSQKRLDAEQKKRKAVRQTQRNFITSLVENFNLRQLLETPGTRERLRMAGLRSQGHLYSFLLVKAALPFIAGLIAFIYSNQILTQWGFGGIWIFAITLGAIMLGFYLPNIFLTSLIDRRQLSINRSWPDTLDLLLICVEAGMSIEVAFQRVAKEIGQQSLPLAEEMLLTTAELNYLQSRRQAFENLHKRVGLAVVKATAMSLIQAERYGSPIGQTLRVLAQENRELRLTEAERKAASMGPKLTVPLVLFFMPVIFIIVIAPVAMEAMKQFAGTGLL